MTLLEEHPFQFQHGADFAVKYLDSGRKGNAVIHRYAVTGGGYKVFFEMMKLLPRDHREALRPRGWGFGALTDPTTGRVVWKFDSFIDSLFAKQLGLTGFKGDLTTECGDDNRTYVVCRRRPSGEEVARFLLAYLLPQWQGVDTQAVPALLPESLPAPVVASVSAPEPVAMPAPTLVFEQVRPTEVNSSRSPSRPRLVNLSPKRLTVSRPALSVATARAPIEAPGVDREHRWFFEQVLARMP